MVFAGLAALFFAFSGFGQSILAGIATLIISPIIFLLYVMLARMWLEITIVVFRISENVSLIAEAKKTPAVPPAGPVA
jgi:hypothetical protein